MPARWTIAAVFALLTLVWGTTWAAIRVSLLGIPPITGVVLRFAISGLLLLAAVPWLKIRLGANPGERRAWVINALCTFAASYGIVYWAEQWVPSGLASVLFATFPLFVSLLAHWMLPGEPLKIATVVGVLLGFAGVAVIFSEDFAKLGDPGMFSPALIFLLSPLASAVGAVSTKKWGASSHPLSLAAVPMVISSALLAPLAVWLEHDRPIGGVGAAPWWALLYLAVFGSALTFTLYYWLIHRTSATFAALIGYTVPVVAVAVGAVAFGEPVTARVGVGGALVLLGVGVTLARRR